MSQANNREAVRSAPPRRRSNDPWSKLQEAMKEIGGLVAGLAEGRATLDRGTLTIGLPGGRKLADGRRAMRNPALADAVARCYPDRTEVDIVPLPGTGTKKDVQDALERRVLADPDMKRILEVLDATLTRVVPLTDDGEGDG